jgi:translation initiation factor 2-alpha kinase 3
MELCDKITLREWLHRNNNSEDKLERIWIFKQITQAVDYVHESGLMHRDLKPSNIFFSKEGTVKVGDFGLVTAIGSDKCLPTRNHSRDDLLECINSSAVSSNGSRDPRHTNNVGTCLYMSPEQLAGSPYCNKVDVFSLGVIFFELLNPFKTEMERLNTLQQVRERQFPKFFTSCFPEESELSKKLLSEKPSERPTANEILSHPVLKTAKSEYRVRKRTLSQCPSESGDSVPLK